MDPTLEKILLMFAAAVVGGGMTLGGKIIFDWFKSGRVSGEVVNRDDCEKSRAECRAMIQKDLDHGSEQFKNQGEDNKAIKRALIIIIMTLIPICKAVAPDQADCHGLERAAEELSQ